MNTVPQPSEEMQLIAHMLRDSIDYLVTQCGVGVRNGIRDTAPASEKTAYELLNCVIDTEEALQAFLGVVKEMSIAIVSTFFAKIDEGIEDLTPLREIRHFDIVDRHTRKSIITYSAMEEFWHEMPDGFLPFRYSDAEYPWGKKD